MRPRPAYGRRTGRVEARYWPSGHLLDVSLDEVETFWLRLPPHTPWGRKLQTATTARQSVNHAAGVRYFTLRREDQAMALAADSESLRSRKANKRRSARRLSTLQACRAATAERRRDFVWKKDTIAPACESFPTPCQASSDSNAKAVSTCPTRALEHRDRGWSQEYCISADCALKVTLKHSTCRTGWGCWGGAPAKSSPSRL